jgi:hypothetical protein
MKLQYLALGVLLLAMTLEIKPVMGFATEMQNLRARMAVRIACCGVSLLGCGLSLKAIYSQNVELSAIAIELADSGAKISHFGVTILSKVVSIEFPKNISTGERDRLERLWERYKTLRREYEWAIVTFLAPLTLLKGGLF